MQPGMREGVVGVGRPTHLSKRDVLDMFVKCRIVDTKVGRNLMEFLL
jgi:hypothetical protein